MYGQKEKFSTFSYKLVQISPIMIFVNSGAFLSISSWFCELTELIFVMILYISSTGYPPPPPQKKNAKDYGYVQVANSSFYTVLCLVAWPALRKRGQGWFCFKRNLFCYDAT